MLIAKSSYFVAMSRPIRYLMVGAFLAFCSLAQAQRLEYGLGHFQSKERLLLPNRFQGLGGQIRYHRAFNIGISKLHTSLGMDLGVERSPQGFYGILLNQTFNMHYVLSRFSPSWKSASYGHYYLGIDDAHLYWTTLHFAGIQLNEEFLWKNLIWHVELGLPLLGMYSRPEAQRFESNWRIRNFYGYLNSGMRWGTALQVFNPELVLSCFLKKGQVRYRFVYLSNFKGAQATVVQHKISYAKYLTK